MRPSLKPAGAGRILLWSGGSLWIGRAGAATEVHAHHAVQCSVALRETGLRLGTQDGDWTRCRAALVAANTPHAFDGDGELVANLFVEPESHAGQALQLLCGDKGICPLVEIPFTELADLFAAYENKAGDEELTVRAQLVVARLAATSRGPQRTLDPRVGRALAYVRARIGDESIPLAAVAAAAHLSPDRFRHLFLAQTGIRFRPYVLWLRIEVALSAYARHTNLTAAAQAAGFADSAHFSRSFKSMFGVTPSSIHID